MPPEPEEDSGGMDWDDQPKRIFASALGPALNRQAGFAAARPAAKRSRQREAVLPVVGNDRTGIAGSADRQLRGAFGALGLDHDLIAQLIEARSAGSSDSAGDIGGFDFAFGGDGSRR